MSKLKDFWYFIKYIVKIPFIDIWEIFKRFNYPKAWLYFSLFAFITAVVLQSRFNQIFFFCLFFISLIWLEYSKGEWKHQQRQDLKERAKDGKEYE